MSNEKDIRDVTVLKGLEGIKELLIKWEEEAIQFQINEARAFQEWNRKGYQLMEEDDKQVKAGIITSADARANRRQRLHATQERFTRYIIDLMFNYGTVGNTTISKITSDVKKEAVKKYYTLVARIIKITGENILSTSNMHYGFGDINGTITGEKGTARVNTIDAGGYNIQCYHFRVLVKEVK